MQFDEALSALMKEGRRTGSVSLEQVAAHLPVEQMDTPTLAALIERLEAEGIEVELDPELSRGRHDAQPPEHVADLLHDTAPPPPIPSVPPQDTDAEGVPRSRGTAARPPEAGRPPPPASSRKGMLILILAALLAMAAAAVWLL